MKVVELLHRVTVLDYSGLQLKNIHYGTLCSLAFWVSVDRATQINTDMTAK